MGKSLLIALAVVLCSSVADAQVSPAPLPPPLGAQVPPPPLAPPGPPNAAPPLAPPPALAPTPIPPAFLAGFLAYDDEAKLVVKGSARRPLSADELFTELGRPDLVERSRAARRRRLAFAISGGVVLTAGLVTAAVARAGIPDLNSAFCVADYRNYNEVCVPDVKRREAIAATGIIAGISLGGVLGALALASSPNPLSKDETLGLIANHNTTLMRRARDGARNVHLTPTASWKGGGLALSFQF